MMYLLTSDKRWRQHDAIARNNGRVSDVPETKQIMYNSKGFSKSIPRVHLSLSLSHLVKSYGRLCQILACFTSKIHQIWTSRVTHIANFENFLL